MSDVKCPYCGKEQEINHDDGYGYDDMNTHEQECPACDKSFKFTTTISFSYEVFCCDGDHDLEQSPVEGCERLYNCSKCDFYEVRQ